MQSVDFAGLISEVSKVISARRYDNGVRPEVRNLRGTYDPVKKTVTLTWEYDKLDEPFTYLVYRSDADKLTSYSHIKDQNAHSFMDQVLPNANTVRYSVKILAESGAESKLAEPVSVQLR